MRKELSEKQIRDEFRSPSKRAVIDEAVRHQEWIRLHSETKVCQHPSEGISAPFRALLAMMESQLPRDKYEAAKSLIRFPLASTDLVDTVFDDLSDIFTGRNPVFSYEFRNAKSAEDWEWYRTNVLGEPTVWSGFAWQFFRSEINSIVVVDLPAEGESDPEDPLPQPYFYFVPIASVVSYGLDRRGRSMEWVMFHNSEGGVTVIDGVSYRTFSLDDKGNLGSLMSQNPHSLDTCPASFFWNQPLSVTNPDVKQSPITKVLSKLDWYVFSDVSKRTLDLSGAYPIYWGFEEECDYDDGHEHHCEHGVLCDGDGKPWIVNGLVQPCPVCARHTVTGAGSFVRVPIPTEGQPDLRDPVGMLQVDRNSLDYTTDDLRRQRQEIIDSCIGKDSDIVQEASLADKQVDATYEKRTTVLENVKKGFEAIQKFVDSTVCKLRYGADDFMQCSISYGTVFFTMTVETLRERYRAAADSGASQSELQSIAEQILQTEYRNNPQLLERMRILLQVEPYPYLSRGDVFNLWEKGFVDSETLELKENFNQYLARFERENINITEFAVEKPLEARVNTITKTLEEYVRETRKDREGRDFVSTGSGAGDPADPAGAGEAGQVPGARGGGE